MCCLFTFCFVILAYDTVSTPDAALLDREATGTDVETRVADNVPQDDAVQQAAATSAATASFFNRLRQPAAVDVLTRLRSFVHEFALRDAQGTLPRARRAAVVRRFVDGMTLRVSQHPAWRNASEIELTTLPDALEKYATTKLYKM